MGAKIDVSVKRTLTALFVYVITGIACLEAAHIVGGDITYECLGNNTYRFTMKVYRDPVGGGAFFDSPASIAIYRCGNTIPCNALNTSQAFSVHSVIPTNIKVVPNPVYPCLTVPPNVLVEEATYTFTTILPQSTENYFVVYQRCCRNNTINNIYNPQDAGATFSVEITSLAQQLCNSSPVFTGFPPTVICAGEPLQFLHDALDPNGDQIVYEFCAPQDGGGKIQQGPGTNGCAGVMPVPPCPPPYAPVNYILPAYSPTAPLGGNPVVTIDPVTGLISGTPLVLGQFVVGVCIYEYRNGQLLSIIRRDFQFNVTNCQPTVIAQVASDSVVGPKSFMVNSCGNETIQFFNESYQVQNIFSYNWSFQTPGGVPITSTAKDPLITFPGVGNYQGKMVLNAGQPCADSATIYVNVFPQIEADFSFDYDTCIAGEVTFQDSSRSPAQIIHWDWLFETGASSTQQNPAYLYSTPGSKPVRLTVTDENNCSDQITKEIDWYPVPPLIIVQPSSFSGCEPAEVFFNNLSKPIDSTYSTLWDFGDGNQGTAISPTHIYTQPGTYDVSLVITSPIGCMTQASFSQWIHVSPSPQAAFTFTPQTIGHMNPGIQFQDESTGASYWNWLFDDNGSATSRNPYFVFPDTGLQRVVLTVTHASGCQDTAVAYIDIVPEVILHMPNAFTPNLDGTNDFFLGQGIFTGMKDYEMRIFNRWGEQIFSSDDPMNGWDGRIEGTSAKASPGVYVYQVIYGDSRGNTFQQQGFVTLVE